MKTNYGSSPDSVTKLLQRLEGDQKDKQGGFFDLPLPVRCRHPEHEPPQHLYIPAGKGYVHVCPDWGVKYTLIPTQITF